MEVLFVTGLVIAVATSYLFIPKEQHDARGLTILACMGAMALIGWTLRLLEAPGAVAWLTATVGTLAIARVCVRQARRASRAHATAVAAHPNDRQLSRR